jgi:hypothetical protein
MRLEDAKREVLSWLDPEGSPRVDAAYYMTESRMRDVGLDDEDAFVRAFNYWLPADATPFPDGGAPRLLVVVTASQRVEEWEYTDQHRAEGPISGRTRIVAVFDATTGEKLTAATFGPDTATKLARLTASGRSQLRDVTPLAMSTATTGTPRPRRTDTFPRLPSDATTLRPLAAGEVPAALADAVRAVPYVNGARWEYRFPRSFWVVGDVRWTRHVITRTIDAAWQIAPDAMLVRQRQQISKGGHLDGDHPPTKYWFVFPEGIVGDLGQASVAEARGTLAAPKATWEPGTRPKVEINEVLRLPLRAPDIWANWWFAVQGRGSVAVRAGNFASCFSVEGRTEGGAGDGSVGWLCPGVGHALYMVMHRGPSYGQTDTMELREYSIPPITRVGDDP